MVINMTQNLKFHRSHHAGIFDGVGSPVGEENPRVRYQWRPKDSIESGESERPCRTDVRQDRVVEFPPGTIAPRGVIWLMPDNADQLPSLAKSHELVNPFFQAWYRHQEVIKALKYKARTESEVMEKLRFTTTPTEMDDRVARTINQHLDQIEQRAKSMNSNSSNDS